MNKPFPQIRSICLGLWLILTSMAPLSAQNCLPILRDAQQAFHQGHFRTALTILQKAETCDIDSKILDQRQRLQDQIFDAIEAQRIRASEAEQQAKAAQEELLVEKGRVEVALEAAKLAHNKADSALALNEAVLSKLFFYEERFGLTVMNIGDAENPRYRYGYINRLGKTQIPFRFQEATPFSQLYGIARVRENNQDYFLDTTGRTFPLATSLQELTAKTEALDLRANLPESLPENLEDFSNLKILLLSGNTLNRGKLTHIPASLSLLSKLEILDLSWNKLKALPDNFGSLSALRILRIKKNLLTAFPEEAGQLAKLEYLDASYNRLTSFPSRVNAWSSLRHLELRSNQLAVLPADIGSLSQLSYLNLRFNKLQKLPDKLDGLTSLERLNLSRNQSLQLSNEICHIISLQHLDLGGIKLPALPDQIGKLTKLSTLDAGSNQLTALPESMGGLTNLYELQLNQNQLTTLPDFLLSLTALRMLDLRTNQLTRIPTDIHKMESLQRLYLAINQIEFLPAELLEISSLKEVDIEKNPLKTWHKVFCERPDLWRVDKTQKNLIAENCRP